MNGKAQGVNGREDYDDLVVLSVWVLSGVLTYSSHRSPSLRKSHTPVHLFNM